MLAVHLLEAVRVQSATAQNTLTPTEVRISLVINVISTVLAIRVARRKGRSPIEGALLGVLCSLVGVIIELLLPDRTGAPGVQGGFPWQNARPPQMPPPPSGPYGAPSGPPPGPYGAVPADVVPGHPGSPQPNGVPGAFAPPRITDLNPNRVFPLEPPPGMQTDQGDGGTWEVDPWAHFPSRWWDGNRWTEHVADTEQVFHVDPI